MNKQRVFSFFVSWLEGCPHGGISLQSFRCQKCCARSCKVVPLPPNNVSWLICSFQGKGYGVHYDDSTIVIHFSELLQLRLHKCQTYTISRSSKKSLKAFIMAFFHLELPLSSSSPFPFLQIAKENARPLIPKFVNHHLQRIIDICWNADPNKRPRFEKIQPILDKLEV